MSHEAQRHISSVDGREEFAVPVKCAGCDQTGSIIWSENALLNRARGPERMLVLISGGFHKSERVAPSGDPEIVCNRCETALPD